jgi:mRNA-degrading endonuclease toxin of MazEF toxin-antitoxin module
MTTPSNHGRQVVTNNHAETRKYRLHYDLTMDRILVMDSMLSSPAGITRSPARVMLTHVHTLRTRYACAPSAPTGAFTGDAIMTVIKTAVPTKVAHVPAATLKALADIRKSVTFIVRGITDDHGAETSVSARMLRFGLADAASAFGKKSPEAQGRALVYLSVAYLNGTQSMDGIRKACPTWLGQVVAEVCEPLKRFAPMPPDVERVALAMADAMEKRGAVPKKEKTESATAEGTVNPTNATIPVHGTEAAKAASAVFARREAQRKALARKVRTMREHERGARALFLAASSALKAAQAEIIRLQAELAAAQAPSMPKRASRKQAVAA